MKNNLLAGVLLMATGSANAMLINIDFGPSSSTNYTGQGILGTALDTTWNAVDLSGMTNLAYADGTTGSGIDITTNYTSESDNLTSGSLQRTNTLLADRLTGFPDGLVTRSITIIGLVENAAYDLVFYNGFYAQTYTADGQSVNIDPISASSANQNYLNWTEGDEYVRLYSVMTDGSGTLVIKDDALDGTTYYSNDGPFAAIAGLQIQSVPNLPDSVPVPPAVYLFGTGLLGLARIARRKKT